MSNKPGQADIIDVSPNGTANSWIETTPSGIDIATPSQKFRISETDGLIYNGTSLDTRYASIVDPLAVACGFRNWNTHPAAFDTAASLTSQVIYAQAIWLPAGVATGAVLTINRAGTGTAPTGFFVGLCSQTTMLAQSSNLNASAALTTTGLGQFPFSSTYTVPAAGLYYVVILENGAFGTTTMQIMSGFGYQGLSGAAPLGGNIGTGQTALPANGAGVTFSAASPNGGKFVGVY